MQGDLISRKELIEALRKNCGIWKDTTESFIKVIEEQPTAYSVEKVVAELQKRADDNRICVDRLQGIEKKTKLCEWKGRAGGFETAIRVVRNGGKE